MNCFAISLPKSSEVEWYMHKLRWVVFNLWTALLLGCSFQIGHTAFKSGRDDTNTQTCTRANRRGIFQRTTLYVWRLVLNGSNGFGRQSALLASGYSGFNEVFRVLPQSVYVSLRCCACAAAIDRRQRVVSLKPNECVGMRKPASRSNH